MRSAVILVATCCLAAGANAQSADPVYKGKQIRIVVGSGAGGGYDVYSRTLAHHLDRHIAGNPSIIVQNMPGAAGMQATNWAYNVAPKDGSVIVATFNGLLPEPLFGDPMVQYDPLKFEWVGSIGKQQNICVTWHASPIKTIEDATKREVTVSSTGATGYSATMPVMLNGLLGTKFKVVIGYTTTEARLAVERGESEGICGLSWTTLKASNPDWVQNKRINILVQTGSKRQAELPDVPLLVDLVKTEDDRRVVDLISFSEDMGRPMLMPPGTPKAMVEAVRRGFDETMRDPAFLEEAKKVSMDVDPLTGDEMQRILERNYATPKALVERAAKLLAVPNAK